MKFEKHSEQIKQWPVSGRHIMAQFDAGSVIVYQAYRASIGRFAIANQCFGGDFSYKRMSWIKPNFLWMMYRSGWASKEGQEMVLAVRIQRSAFDQILALAVHSTFGASSFDDRDEWQAQVAGSEVRLQWDPDHGLHGEKLERRALQLGLRGSTLRRYGTEWVQSIEDVSQFAREQAELIRAGHLADVITPEEGTYPVTDRSTAERIGVDPIHP